MCHYITYEPASFSVFFLSYPIAPRKWTS